MNLLDLLIIVAAIGAAIGGYRLGFVTRAFSWIGLALGIVVANLVLPGVVRRFDGTEHQGAMLAIAVGIFILGAIVGQGLGMVVGRRFHVQGQGWLHHADAGAGAVAGVAGIVVAVWLLAPAMADVTGWPARQARESAVVREVGEVLPDAPDTTDALRRLVGDRYPQVFDALRPAPSLGAPPGETGLDQATAQRIAASTVRLESEACDSLQDGTGFVVAPDLVATNAHVVAGASDISVERSDGTDLDGTTVLFDPDRDLALVSVPGIDRPALARRDADIGTRGGVFGHPGGGPLRIAPFRVDDRATSTGTNIYDTDRTERDVLFLAAGLKPGDSGSAVVDDGGRVVGIAFAIAPDRANVAYALAMSELDEVLAQPRSREIGTGPCIR